MGETAEKIYCCDRDNNDNALAAAILANGNNRRDDWGPMAAMMGGGMNNWMNNHSSSCTSGLIEIKGAQGSFYTSLGILFFINNPKDKLYAVIQRYKAELSCIHS